MIQITLDVRALRRLLLVLLALAVAMAALATVRSAWADVDDPPLPTVAFVARADNPVDALAAAGVAGQLGAPVYLTFPGELGSDAAGGLTATDPDIVVLAGGPAALSARVAEQVTALLPDARVIRREGGTRTSTAVALNQLPSELGFDRPVLAGATVPGNAGIAGELTVDGVQVAATLAQLTTRVDDLETALATANGRVDGLVSDLAAANARIGGLETTLAGVTRDGDVLTLSGMNLQLVNGQGTTDTTNGLGNLIVGYNQQRPTPATRSGSHYLVVGDQHAWTAFGGIVAGFSNTASGDSASVTGGELNTASGIRASVSGGRFNSATGSASSVTGGLINHTSGTFASVSGGDFNTASGTRASVSGGHDNTASGSYSSVTGGYLNTASGNSASVVGGREGAVAGSYDSLIGDMPFPDAP